MARIFVLFAPPDREIAAQVCAELRAASISVLTDEDIAYAQDYMEALNDALYGSDAVVVLLSPFAFKMRLVTGVLQFALEIGKPVLPLLTAPLNTVQLAMPEDLQALADTPWYDAADSAAWLSALLSEDSFFPELAEADAETDAGDEAEFLQSSAERQVAFGDAEDKSALPTSHASRPPAPIPAQVSPQSPVAFTAYSPRETPPAAWQPLLAYIYREHAAPAVASDAAAALGERAPGYRRQEEDARAPIADGALVTATPHLPGFEINPPSLSLPFFLDWHRFDFRIRPAGAPVNLAANGRITFTVEGVIAADLPLSVYVTSGAASVAHSPAAPAGVRPYQSVFCSYSHKDEAIVERVERVVRLLGITYLRDATTLRSGENWSAALMAMIERADIFQLFWSTNAAASHYVQREWEHALSIAAGRASFIRPVYWQEPMPPPPAALAQIHFEYDPTLDDD
jgi:hypothetical protein